MAGSGREEETGDRRQKEERTDLAQRYRVILKMLLKRWVQSLLFRGILKMPFFNNQQAEIQEFKKHKASWYF